jgi:hypothetical protein
VSDLMLGGRRSSDPSVAALEAWARGHENACTRDRVEIFRRIGRIENGILAVWTTITMGGAATIGLLLKILLHLG